LPKVRGSVKSERTLHQRTAREPAGRTQGAVSGSAAVRDRSRWGGVDRWCPGAKPRRCRHEPGGQRSIPRWCRSRPVKTTGSAPSFRPRSTSMQEPPKCSTAKRSPTTPATPRDRRQLRTRSRWAEARRLRYSRRSEEALGPRRIRRRQCRSARSRSHRCSCAPERRPPAPHRRARGRRFG